MRRWNGLALLALAAACSQENEFKPPPPPAVTVATPERRDVIEYAVFSGITEAHKTVEIRARVRGYIAEIAHEAGAPIEKDTVLFRIADDEFQANVRSAEADVASAGSDVGAAQAAIESAEANVALAETAVTKLERAYASRAVSEILVLETKAKRDVANAELDKAKASLEVAEAKVGIAQANLERARLDLDWTTVRAPMSGRAAMWKVFVGDFVGGSNPTLLTTMVNDEKIYCWFNVPERWVLEIQKRIRTTEGRRAQAADVIVEMALVTDEGFPHKGIGDYADPTLDPDTGTARVRAIFDNAERVIPGGGFARVRIPVGERKNALLVPERALGSDQSGDYLLLVNSENTVERHEVALGPREKGQVVIEKGIQPDSRVIVSGLQRARPGIEVKPEPGHGNP